MNKYTILVIEDDPAILQGVVDALQFSGYRVLSAKTGEAGLETALSADCDLVLLDLILPGINGLDVLESIRKSRAVMPVIILTAKGEERDRVRGLKLGADDYVVKPFSIKELIARVEAVLRRSPGRSQGVGKIRTGQTVIDLEKKEAVLPDGSRVVLSDREAELLAYLAANRQRVISRQEILQHVWHIDKPRNIETRTIDMHIVRLREKLSDNDPENRLIQTIRGKGYFVNLQDGEAQ